MDSNQLRNILEACLLVSGKPMSLRQLQALFDDDIDKPDKAELCEALASLQQQYEGRGIELVEVASGWRLQSRECVQHWVSRLFQERAPRYSRALLETLALIAYRQPITRGEIEEIRGVAVSSTIIKTLQEREWVRVVGEKDVPGKPALLGTTSAFLDYFNLKRLDELPDLNDIRSLDDIDPTLARELGLVDDSMTDAEPDADDAHSNSGDPPSAETATADQPRLDDSAWPEAEAAQVETAETENAENEVVETETADIVMAEVHTAEVDTAEVHTAEVHTAEVDAMTTETINAGDPISSSNDALLIDPFASVDESLNSPALVDAEGGLEDVSSGGSHEDVESQLDPFGNTDEDADRGNAVVSDTEHAASEVESSDVEVSAASQQAHGTEQHAPVDVDDDGDVQAAGESGGRGENPMVASLGSYLERSSPYPQTRPFDTAVNDSEMDADSVVLIEDIGHAEDVVDDDVVPTDSVRSDPAWNDPAWNDPAWNDPAQEETFPEAGEDSPLARLYGEIDRTSAEHQAQIEARKRLDQRFAEQRGTAATGDHESPAIDADGLVLADEEEENREAASEDAHEFESHDTEP